MRRSPFSFISLSQKSSSAFPTPYYQRTTTTLNLNTLLIVWLFHLTDQVIYQFFLVCCSFAPEIFTEHILCASHWNQTGPCGAPGHKSPPGPPSARLEKIGFIQPLDLPWVLVGRLKQWLSREGRGCRDKGRAVKKQLHSLGAGSWFLLKGYIWEYPWIVSQILKPPAGKKLTVCCPQARRPQTGWNQKVDDADSYLSHHQPIKIRSTSWSHCPLWTITMKLLTTSSRFAHTVLRVLAHCGPLCLAEK